MQLMIKINKEFDQRCMQIRNRIQRIKNEELNYQKKMINFRRKEINDKLIQEDKRKFRNELQKNKEADYKALVTKKLYINSVRVKDNMNRKNKKEANLSQKKLNYQSSLNDKYLMRIIKEQLNNQQLNKKTCTHAKVRQELNEYETNKVKKKLEKENKIQQIYENNIVQLKRLEKEMKHTCSQLEELEKQAIDSLSKTKHMSLKIMGHSKTNYNVKDFNKNRKYNNSMENMNFAGIAVGIENKINPNKSLHVKKAGYFSPHRTNNRKLNLNYRNKSANKYGHTYYKKRQSKSKEKIGVNQNSSYPIKIEKSKDRIDIKEQEEKNKMTETEPINNNIKISTYNCKK